MPRQARKESCTGIFHVMMRGINHQNISDLRSSLLTLDNAQASLALYSLNRSLEDEEDNYQLIKEKTGVTNSGAFQQLPEETKRSVLIELKGMRASLRQLERLTGIWKNMIFRM